MCNETIKLIIIMVLVLPPPNVTAVKHYITVRLGRTSPHFLFCFGPMCVTKRVERMYIARQSSGRLTILCFVVVVIVVIGGACCMPFFIIFV